METEKMIEEMAEVLHDRIINKTWRAKKVAEELYKIAVPEGAVVLTREEYGQLKSESSEIAKDYQEMARFYSEEADKNDRLKERISDIREAVKTQARKETAEKIFAMLQCIGTLHTEFDWNDYLQIDIDDFYKLAKQFGVEIEG